MADIVQEFFDGLAEQGRIPLLHMVDGTFGFQIGGRYWFVRVQKGAVTVSRRRSRADCELTGDERLFSAFVSGEKNALTAAMRGELSLVGDAGLLMLFQRVFPGAGDTDGPPRDQQRGAR